MSSRYSMTDKCLLGRLTTGHCLLTTLFCISDLKHRDSWNVSFKPVIVWKVCVTRFAELLECGICDKWLCLPLPVVSLFSLHFFFMNSSWTVLRHAHLSLKNSWILLELNYAWTIFLRDAVGISSPWFWARGTGFRNTVSELLQSLNSNIPFSCTEKHRY